MPRQLQFLVGCLLALFAVTAPAQAQTPLFSEHTELEILIEGPVNDLVRRASRSTDPIDATLSVTGFENRWQIQLGPRGVSRRTGGLCAFPPLRIDFADGAVRGTIFRGQNRLKVVTRCRPGANFEALTVLEYMVYRLYNEITPLSYRVRPARITYRHRRDEVQWNFLIEDVDDLARRNRLVALDVANGVVRAADLNPEAAARYGLFQYMIGNLDWDMVAGRPGSDCCHNSRLLGANAQARQNLIPAPYDFDYSGFVSAPYAIPPESVPVRTVRQRYFRGYCRFNDQLPAAIAFFQSRRAALFAIVDGEMRLPEARRQTARRFLEEFFQTIDDPREVERQLIARCR